MQKQNILKVAGAAAILAIGLLPALASAQQADTTTTTTEQDATFALQAGSVSGYVFVDKNGNGEEDEEDVPAKGCKVTVQGSQTNVLYTDSDGSFETQEVAGAVTAVVATDSGDCSGGKVSTASAGGSLSQTVTVVGGKSAVTQPVGITGVTVTSTTTPTYAYGSPATNTNTNTTSTTKTLANTSAQGMMALALALSLLVAGFVVQVFKKKFLSTKVKVGSVNLLE